MSATSAKTIKLCMYLANVHECTTYDLKEYAKESLFDFNEVIILVGT